MLSHGKQNCKKILKKYYLQLVHSSTLCRRHSVHTVA